LDYQAFFFIFKKIKVMRNIFKYNPETLSFEKIKKKTYFKVVVYSLSIFTVLFFIGWLTGTNRYIVNNWVHKTEVTDTLKVHGEPFSEEALVRLMRNSNIKYPHIVLAQAKLESANFTSKIFKQNHNMFGMRMPRQRPTAAIREANGFAVYRDWQDCLYDYMLYQANAMSTVDNEVEYFTRLEEKYCTDTGYVSSVKELIKRERLKHLFDE
jgi:hypothetical protein